MNRLFLINLLILSALISNAKCVIFSDCGSETGHLEEMSVKGCTSSDQECILKVGSNADMDLQFTSLVDSKTATVKIWGIIGGVPIPFNFQPSNACSNWGIDCPLVNGSKYNLKISLPVLAKYPKIKVGVRLALLDDQNKKLQCQQFPAQIEA